MGFLCARPYPKHFTCINSLSPHFNHQPFAVGTIIVILFYFLAFIFSYFHFGDEDSKALKDVAVVNFPKEAKPGGWDSRVFMFNY